MCFLEAAQGTRQEGEKLVRKVSMSNVHKIKESGKQKHLRADQNKKKYGGHVSERDKRGWLNPLCGSLFQDTFDDAVKFGFGSH